MPTERHQTYTPWKAILQLEAIMEDEKPRKLTNTEYRVLMRMIVDSDPEGLVTGTMVSLSNDAGVSRTMLARTIPDFIELGLIERVKEGRKGDPAIYRVTL